MTHLKTNNLVLRAVTENDVEEVARMWELGAEPLSPGKAHDVIKRLAENHEKNKPGHIHHLCLAVFKGDHIIGWCGLDGTRDGIVNIFYLIDAQYRNNGYATECASAVFDYGFNVFKVPVIHGRCFKDNVPSRRVLEKCGMSVPADEGDTLHYAVSEETYTKGRH